MDQSPQQRRRPCGSHAERGGSAIATLEVTIASHRPQGEKLRITVIAKVKNPRKTRRRVERLIPEAVVALGQGQICDSARDGRMMGFAGGHRAETPPGGCGGGAG